MNIEKLLVITFPVLLTALLASIITRNFKKRQRLIAAADNLRAAFAPALAQVDAARSHNGTHCAPDLDGFLLAAIQEQATAIKAFRFLLEVRRHQAYDMAWTEYREAVKGGVFVADFLGQDPFRYFEQKIQNVLEFARKPNTYKASPRQQIVLPLHE